MNFRTFSVAAAVSAASVSLLAGEVQPNALFSDHMVLQQGQTVPVWGTGNPGEKVTVQFGEQEVSTTTGEDGR